jgi:hypothetical protein
MLQKMKKHLICLGLCGFFTLAFGQDFKIALNIKSLEASIAKLDTADYRKDKKRLAEIITFSKKDSISLESLKIQLADIDSLQAIKASPTLSRLKDSLAMGLTDQVKIVFKSENTKYDTLNTEKETVEKRFWGALIAAITMFISLIVSVIFLFKNKKSNGNKEIKIPEDLKNTEGGVTGVSNTYTPTGRSSWDFAKKNKSDAENAVEKDKNNDNPIIDNSKSDNTGVKTPNEQLPITNPVFEGQPEIFYMSIPSGERYFIAGNQFKSFQKGRTSYKFSVLDNRAEFEFCSEAASNAIDQAHLHIIPVCEPTNIKPDRVTSIETIEKGTAHLEADRWIVDTKAKIKYI